MYAGREISCVGDGEMLERSQRRDEGMKRHSDWAYAEHWWRRECRHPFHRTEGLSAGHGRSSSPSQATTSKTVSKTLETMNGSIPFMAEQRVADSAGPSDLA